MLRQIPYFGLLLLSLFANSFALALVPGSQPPFAISKQTIRPNTVAGEKAAGSFTIYDPVDGSLRVMNLLTPQTSLSEEAQISAWLSAYLPNLNPADLVLNQDALLRTLTHSARKYQVWRSGLLIEDAYIDFRFFQGRLVQVINQSFLSAAVSSSVADSSIQTLGSEPLTKVDQRYRVVVQDDGYELVRVTSYDWRFKGEPYVVQAHGEKIFEVAGQRLYRHGSVVGEVIPRDWTEEVLQSRFPFLTVYSGDSDISSDQNGYFQSNSAPELRGFVGQYFKVETGSGEMQAATGVVVDDKWQIESLKSDQPKHADQMIAQPTAYHHGMKVREFAKGYLDHPWLDSQVAIVTNYPSNCNAFWDGKAINLLNAGGECAHSGLIADVIYHEWAHGLDHNTGGIADVPFSEGFADTVSMLITDSAILAPNFYLDGGFVRDMAPDKIYPYDRGEVHHEGLIFGSTMWDVYQAMKGIHGDQQGKAVLASQVFPLIVAATHYRDAYQTLLFLDDDDGDLTNGTPHYCVYNVEFARHGLAEADDECRLAAYETTEFTEVVGNSNGVIEPGEELSGFLKITNPTSHTLTNLKAEVRIEALDGVVMDPQVVSFGAIDSGASAYSIEAFHFSVQEGVPCGTELTLVIRFFEDRRNLVVYQKLEVGAMRGEPQTFSVSGLPITIPDQSSLDLSIWVKGDAWPQDRGVYNAAMKFDVTHPYSGDIEVHLISPDGYDKKLIRGLGGQDDIHYDRDLTQMFKGRRGRGIWTIRITDWGKGDTGTLDDLKFTLTPAHFVCEAVDP